MQSVAQVRGTCDYRFRGVQQAFVESFVVHRDVGGSVAVMLEGRPVVDLWGGSVDAARTRPWTEHTIVHVHSCTKGMVALCANRLAEEGLLDLDAPIAKYWPEFADSGKGGVTLRMALNHSAGVPAIREPLRAGAQYQWDLITSSVARTAPWWEPGTRHGYHLMTFGWIIGELVRRVTGDTIGAYIRKDIAGPLGLDFQLGVGPEHDWRIADVIPVPARPQGYTTPFLERVQDHDSVAYHVVSNPKNVMSRMAMNSRADRAAEIPAANGHSNARALARAYGILASGGSDGRFRLLGTETIEDAPRTETEGADAVLGVRTRFGLGFMLGGEGYYFGPSRRVFGHPGASGSTAFADLDARLGFGYTVNQMQGGIGVEDPRARRLIDAVYEALS